MSSILSPETIVLPFDFSDTALAVVRQVLADEHRPKQIHILHVVLPQPSFALEHSVEVDERLDDVRCENARCALRDQFAEESDDVHIVAIAGDPGTEIVKYASQVSADAIAMSSHGRTGFKRLWLGSVAERVARTAECPVTIVRSIESKS